jgi:hypothetical protein
MSEENLETRAVRARPLLRAIFDDLLVTVGRRTILDRLSRNLAQPPALSVVGNESPAATMARLVGHGSQFVLGEVEIEENAPAWRYHWRSNVETVPGQITEIQPWNALPELNITLSPPADLQLARRDAMSLWDEATDQFLSKLRSPEFEAFGRITAPTSPYRRLDSDLLDRLSVEPRSNDGDVDGEPVYSLRVEHFADPKRGRPPTQLDATVQALREQYPDMRFPNRGIMQRALKEKGIPTSPRTIDRAIERLRQMYSGE